MPRPSTHQSERGDTGKRVTDFALALAMGLVLARCMMLETLWDAQPVPGQEIVLQTAGPMVTSLLDLLSFVPAILVAGRALLGERFKLRWPLSIGLLALLAVWAMVSVTWAPDRFSAAVSAGKLLGGAAIAWTVLQCVRDWKAFRIICAVTCGLLAVMLGHSLVYRFVELPDTQRAFKENPTQLLVQQGIQEGTFQAEQFARKVMAGELMGFVASPNTLAALAAMVSVIVMGSLWQRHRDGGPTAWHLPGIVLLVGAGWIIWSTQSNTAMVTPVLGLIVLAGGWRLRGWIGRHRAKAFTGGVMVLLLGWAAVIAHGLYHGNLVQRSLTFRWQYWVASIHLLKDHLLLGTGWENFGNYYLQYRLPTAPEEIRDPHNLLVRFAAELGTIGLVIAVGWLLRLAWEITRPGIGIAEEPAPQWEAPQEPLKAIAPLTRIALIATILVIVASGDFAQDPLTAIMRRGLYGLLLWGTAVVFAVADLQRPRLERKSAEVLLLGVTCGLAVFLLHNFIDFSLFDTGLFYLFVTLAAAAVGVRTVEPSGTSRGALPLLAGWLLFAAGFGVVVAVPAVQGDMESHQGDVYYAAKQPGQAQQKYAAAFDGSAWLANADYLLRASRAQTTAGDRPANVLATLDRAIAANPRSVTARMGRVSMLAAMKRTDDVVAELARIYVLNSNDIGIRLDAAEFLAVLGRNSLAREQYQAALDVSSHLPADEPKRLSPAQTADIQTKITALSANP